MIASIADSSLRTWNAASWSSRGLNQIKLRITLFALAIREKGEGGEHAEDEDRVAVYDFRSPCRAVVAGARDALAGPVDTHMQDAVISMMRLDRALDPPLSRCD